MRDLIDVPSPRREQLDNFALVETITRARPLDQAFHQDG
jgi:hypothetical protein